MSGSENNTVFNPRRLRQLTVQHPQHKRSSSPNHQQLDINVKAPISRSTMPELNIVILRPKVKATQSKLNVEEDEKIAEEEAICRHCFDIFKEDNVLKTICKCKNYLIHEECEVKWSRERGNNICDVCNQEFQIVPVALIREMANTQEGHKK